MPLHSILGDRGKLHLKKKKKLRRVVTRGWVVEGMRKWRKDTKDTKFQLRGINSRDTVNNIVTLVNNNALHTSKLLREDLKYYFKK